MTTTWAAVEGMRAAYTGSGVWRLHNRTAKVLGNRRRRWARSHQCCGYSRRQTRAIQRQGRHFDRRSYDRLIHGETTGVKPLGLFQQHETETKRFLDEAMRPWLDRVGQQLTRELSP